MSISYFEIITWLEEIIKQLAYFFSFPFYIPIPKTWHMDSLILPTEDEGKGFQETAQQQAMFAWCQR